MSALHDRPNDALKASARAPQPESEMHKAVAFFASLEAALMWVVLPQAHFDQES